MSDVKIVRLQTGEDVIAKVRQRYNWEIIILKNRLLSFQLNQHQVSQYN